MRVNMHKKLTLLFLFIFVSINLFSDEYTREMYEQELSTTLEEKFKSLQNYNRGYIDDKITIYKDKDPLGWVNAFVDHTGRDYEPLELFQIFHCLLFEIMHATKKDLCKLEDDSYEFLKKSNKKKLEEITNFNDSNLFDTTEIQIAINNRLEELKLFNRLIASLNIIRTNFKNIVFFKPLLRWTNKFLLMIKLIN